MKIDVGDLMILNGKTPLLCIDRMELRRFEGKEEKNEKFWEIFKGEKEYTIRWGKMDSDGNSQTKQFASEKEAVEEYNKVVADKLEKGYKEDFKHKDENFIYVFNDPVQGLSKWICYNDLEPFMKKEAATIQRKKI